MKKTYEVAAAVIIQDEKIFCVKRGPGRALENKWEFPGGKIEPGETAEQALIREIREELNTEISVHEKLLSVGEDYGSYIVHLHCYFCTKIEGNLTLSEHTDSAWLKISELGDLDWAPADKIVTEFLMKKEIERKS
jgi:8-oxo-dGTP diphosphatase